MSRHLVTILILASYLWLPLAGADPVDDITTVTVNFDVQPPCSGLIPVRYAFYADDPASPQFDYGEVEVQFPRIENLGLPDPCPGALVWVSVALYGETPPKTPEGKQAASIAIANGHAPMLYVPGAALHLLGRYVNTETLWGGAWSIHSFGPLSADVDVPASIMCQARAANVFYRRYLDGVRIAEYPTDGLTLDRGAAWGTVEDCPRGIGR